MSNSSTLSRNPVHGLHRLLGEDMESASARFGDAYLDRFALASETHFGDQHTARRIALTTSVMSDLVDSAVQLALSEGLMNSTLGEISRTFATNGASLRSLLAHDDMRELRAALDDRNLPSPIARDQFELVEARVAQFVVECRDAGAPESGAIADELESGLLPVMARSLKDGYCYVTSSIGEVSSNRLIVRSFSWKTIGKELAISGLGLGLTIGGIFCPPLAAPSIALGLADVALLARQIDVD